MTWPLAEGPGRFAHGDGQCRWKPSSRASRAAVSASGSAARAARARISGSSGVYERCPCPSAPSSSRTSPSPSPPLPSRRRLRLVVLAVACSPPHRVSRVGASDFPRRELRRWLRRVIVQGLVSGVHVCSIRPYTCGRGPWTLDNPWTITFGYTGWLPAVGGGVARHWPCRVRVTRPARWWSCSRA